MIWRISPRSRSELGGHILPCETNPSENMSSISLLTHLSVAAAWQFSRSMYGVRIAGAKPAIQVCSVIWKRPLKGDYLVNRDEPSVS
jgi:hypothetical protein